MEVLQLDGQDSHLILETIRKLEKVVKAVPRLESFIQMICLTLSDDPSTPLPIEQVLMKAN